MSSNELRKQLPQILKDSKANDSIMRNEESRIIFKSEHQIRDLEGSKESLIGFKRKEDHIPYLREKLKRID